MGKMRQCKRCGKEAWIVAEIMAVIPPVCLACFEDITGCEAFAGLVAGFTAVTHGFRSVYRAECENMMLTRPGYDLGMRIAPF